MTLSSKIITEEISLAKDLLNPFRLNVFTPNPGKRYRHFWGYLIESRDGWIGVHHRFHQTIPFCSQDEAAKAVIEGHLNQQDWEEAEESETVQDYSLAENY